MKKLILTFVISCLCLMVNAQVLNTSHTVGKGKGNFGIMPTLFVNGGSDEFMLFMNGTYGINHGVDLGLKLGVFGNSNFIGMDVAFSKAKNFTLAGGFHSFDDFAMDLTGLVGFNMGKGARLSTGLDMDIVFANETRVPVWVPINLEIWVKENMTFMMEADIDTKLFDQSYHLISAGVQIYF
nr:hypothetical protein [uncultured Carboxylicivirga sp.]